jgi:hypothetical protein
MKLQTRKRRIARQQTAATPYEQMSDDALILAGKAAGFLAGGAGWPRATLVRKLKERN